MHFLHPSNLHWLWLALIPIALWLFRRKAKRMPVSTLLFFRSLAREHQESAWLRRLKKILSLLLSLLVLVLATFVLARPFHGGGGGTPKSLVILLDRSASMSAKNEKGQTRLAEAKSLLKDRLKALPENVITSLVVYDAEAEVTQSRSTSRRELLRLIDQADTVPVEDRPEEALAVAQRLAVLEAPAEIWCASDRRMKIPPEGGTTIRMINVALEHPVNIGITGFQIRPAPLARNRFEAFVEVSASSANEKQVEATLEARLDGRPVQLRQLELKPGESTRLILPLEGGKGQRLEIEAMCPGDCLGWDNVVIAPLPKTRPLVVAWFNDTPDPFVELALSSMLAEERIQVMKGGANDFPPKDKPDVYVFENWLPKDWPADRPALVLNPPSNSGPIHAKKLDKAVPYDSVRAVQPDHPVLYRVTSGRVAVTQTTVLNMSDTLETLWMAGQEPVLAAGQADGQRMVVTAFIPGKSEQLALMSAFPLLIGNALYWCAENNEALASLKPKRPGDFVSLESGIVKWHDWDGAKFINTSEESRGGWFELRRIGIFEAANGKVESSLLLSVYETELPAIAAAAGTSTTENTARRWATGGGWWTKLLWFALGVLLIESWLFHRQTVY
ncbi:MAG: BatA and WFA domain-containing protein [Verrucomicrobia bacterium]|nr:BatA and WFA domain-containing protein [Verrucomicrobiota bacterium]